MRTDLENLYIVSLFMCSEKLILRVLKNGSPVKITHLISVLEKIIGHL